MYVGSWTHGLPNRIRNPSLDVHVYGIACLFWTPKSKGTAVLESGDPTPNPVAYPSHGSTGSIPRIFTDCRREATIPGGPSVVRAFPDVTCGPLQGSFLPFPKTTCSLYMDPNVNGMVATHMSHVCTIQLQPAFRVWALNVLRADASVGGGMPSP